MRCVPDLKRNLISLGILDQLGLSFKSENGILSARKRNNIVIRRERK